MKKQITADEAIAQMKALCERLGIPCSQNQKSRGTASIRFLSKPKKK
jgi:hypothetical protein